MCYNCGNYYCYGCCNGSYYYWPPIYWANCCHICGCYYGHYWGCKYYYNSYPITPYIPIIPKPTTIIINILPPKKEKKKIAKKKSGADW